MRIHLQIVPGLIPRVLVVGLVAVALVLGGCSRIRTVYRSADFLVGGYADNYLALEPAQRAQWRPRLKSVLARHRGEELPRLAGFFDQVLAASRAGFDGDRASCLTAGFRDLYRSHARLAVEAVAPLLAGLNAGQVDALERRFQAQALDDRVKPGTDPDRERRRRARRYGSAIEEWTGPLSPGQRELVAGIAGRMPDTGETVLAYRSQKRTELIGLLRAGAGEREIGEFLTAWLVDYRDLPPVLGEAGRDIEARVGELLVRLGGSLDAGQRERLQSRLTGLRDDLMGLQKAPRSVPLGC